MPVLFKKFLLEALSIAVSAGVALSPPPSGLETEAMWVAGLLVWTLLNLILRYIPDFVVLMMMSCMWVILHIMPFQQAFESFTGTTVWLLVGALGIGTAVTKSGLLTRVALCTMKLCSPTFSGQVFAMLASGVVLSPFIPSTTAKVAVAGALATDVGERLGLEDRSWGMSGIWCAMYTSYSLMSPILMSASYFSYVILNLMPEHIRGDLTLVRWSVAMLPWGVVTFLGAFAAISILYKPKHKIEISREDINEMLHDLGPVTRDEKITIAVVGVCMVCWVFERQLDIPSVVPALMGMGLLMSFGVINKVDYNTHIRNRQMDRRQLRLVARGRNLQPVPVPDRRRGRDGRDALHHHRPADLLHALHRRALALLRGRRHQPVDTRDVHLHLLPAVVRALSERQLPRGLRLGGRRRQARFCEERALLLRLACATASPITSSR